MSCMCRIGGGPDGVCAFHRAEAYKAKQRTYDLKVREWMILQIQKIAKEIGIQLDPFPEN